MPASQARFGLQAKAQSPDVALFIDWENLKISLSQANLKVNLTSLRETAETFGRLVIANAYADWQDDWHQSDPENLYAAGIEPVYVPTRLVTESSGLRRRKNSVDIKLTADCVQCCHTHPNIRTFILASGDGDFIHMVNTLRPYGKQVVAIGVSWSTSPRLADRVDQFLYYDRDVDPIDTQRFRLHGLAPNTGDEAELQRTLELVCDIVRSSQHGDRALLSWIKNELIRRLRQFDESRFGFPKFKLFMHEAERRGLLYIVEDGLVDWAYLPGAREAEELGMPSVASMAEPVDEAALPTIIRFADDLQARSPYVAFMYLVDQIVRAAIRPHLRRDQIMLLLNQAVNDLIFLRGTYTLEDPLSGQAKNIRTLVLNRDHPVVLQTLSAAPPAEPGAQAPAVAGQQGTPADSELSQILVALEADDANAALLMSAARRCYQLRRYEQATEYQRRAVALEPDNVEYSCLLARTLNAAGQTDEAVALCHETAARSPDHALPHVTLGSILYAGGDAWAEAAAEFHNALDRLAGNTAQQAQLLLSIARCEERLGNEEAAQQLCRDGLQLVHEHPGLIEFQSYLQMSAAQREGYQRAKQAASLAVQPGREAEAIAAAQEAIALDPQQYLSYYALGEVHQRLRHLRTAAEHLERAAELCTNPSTKAAAYQKLARLFARLGEPERAQAAQARTATLGLVQPTIEISEEA
ncbi:MAG TPA: NYN domain-containing protein [Anaerolineae bacterium]|nr:NYN domain-containing protein [Anaerolineae bacterium]HOR00890.1 NYN domain-containing protein [Anaerolineae bacterium]HPL29401.1 NYN domain-containing protein [Anaerolineae bacterium]